jgi:hypothetical protein
MRARVCKYGKHVCTFVYHSPPKAIYADSRNLHRHLRHHRHRALGLRLLRKKGEVGLRQLKININNLVISLAGQKTQPT